MKNPVALALTITVPVLVWAIHLVAVDLVAARPPPHFKEALAELSSIRIPILDNLIARGQAKPMIVVMSLGYGIMDIVKPGSGGDARKRPLATQPDQI